MAVRIKDKKLHKQIFSKITKLEDKAIACYKKGDLKCGRKFEKESDKLYSKNYNKIFEVTK